MKGFRLLHNFPLSQVYPGAMRSTVRPVGRRIVRRITVTVIGFHLRPAMPGFVVQSAKHRFSAECKRGADALAPTPVQ
jgi:hypothetical protein